MTTGADGDVAAPGRGRSVAGAFGELVLRLAADGHHEVISNGTFLMDTRDGRSERALATAAIDVVAGDALHVLVAGLGVGFTLGSALVSPRVERVTVVEIEPTVVELVRTATGALTGADLGDPRVELVVGDLVELLERRALPTVDVLCVDVDNGPGWTVGAANDRLYERSGLELLLSHVAERGALAMWSARDDPAFVDLLRSVGAVVAAHSFEVERGDPDVVWVATRHRDRPADGPGPGGGRAVSAG